MPVDVFHRSELVRHFGLALGAAGAGKVYDTPPHCVRSIIDTTPAWFPTVESLQKNAPGGRIVNAIRKEYGDKDALLGLNYHEYLWMEHDIKSVANLRCHDMAEFHHWWEKPYSLPR